MSLSETLNASGANRALMRGVTSEHLCEIEHRRPRIAAAADFLHSAFNGGLSPHTRMRCVFESIYLCCCELSDVHKVSFEQVEHPSMKIVNAAVSVWNLTDAEILELRALTEWAVSNSPFVPRLKPECVCVLARHVLVRTIQFFA